MRPAGISRWAEDESSSVGAAPIVDVRGAFSSSAPLAKRPGPEGVILRTPPGHTAVPRGSEELVAVSPDRREVLPAEP